MVRHSTALSEFSRILCAAILIATPASAAPTTSVTSAANIPYSGVSPGGVDMATGELILVMRPDLAIDGPFPVVFRRYYASMLAREGLASGHLGPNWLGTYDWNLSVASPMVNVVTNRGQQIQFQQNEVGPYVLVAPTDEKYKLAFVGGMWRFTHPGLRQVFLFDGTSHLLTQILDEHGNSLSLTYTTGRLTQVTDLLGRTLTFSYDPTGLLTMVGDGTRSVSYAYTLGALTGVTDAAGQSWIWVYAPGPIQALLTGVTEPLGNVPLTQAYDPSGRVISQTDALGHVAMYGYDAPSGNVFTDPLGNMWTYLHDAQNRLTMLTNPAGGPTSFAYDALGRPSMMTRPMGDMTSFGYDATSGYPSSVALADGSLFTYSYGSHSVGGATLFDLATALYPDGRSESYGRDASGNLTDFTDRGGFHWTGTYNARGQLLTATNPSSGVTTLTYATNFCVVLLSDNAGNATSFSYDGLSRPTQMTWPDATHRGYAYDNLDGLTSLTDERGKVWSYAYDANERLMTETDPLSEGTGFVYDALDRVTQVVDPLGHATGYAYDPVGRLMSMTDRSSRTTGYQYDTVGRLTGVSDPAGGTTTYSYDADSRVTGSQDPLGHVVLIGHDFVDRVNHVTDPVGTGFDYTYDSMGRLLTANAPLGRAESFGYDPRGLLTSFFDVTSETDLPRTSLGEVSQLTDPNRNAWPRGHDPQGRLTSSADPLGRMTSLTYDARSRVTHAVLPLGSVDLTYDPTSRIASAWAYSDGTSLTYTYDDAHRLTGATGASFSYDAAGRMTSSNGFTMTYDNEGRILSETYAPGKVVSYAYDSRGLPSQVMDWMGGTTSFTHDAAQRLTGITRANGTVATYAYDAADRLVSSVENKPPPLGSPLASIAITRDALGQPTSISRRQPLMPAVTMPATTNHTYDPASQIEGFSYDPLGRLVSDGSRTFQWDGASRLTHYAAGAESPTFTYDAFGQMLTRTQGNEAVRQAWNYGHYPPTNDDTQVMLPTPKTSYNVRAPSGLLLYSIDGTTGERSFYHYDEAGNTMFLTNDAGSVVTEYSYTPVGGVTGLGQTANNPFTWGGAAGVIQLGSSGLFQMGDEVYDATTMSAISGIAVQSGPGADKAFYQEKDAVASPGSWVAREGAGTLLHELAHNFSLHHGGKLPGPASGIDNFPNPVPVSKDPRPIQLSVMNYRYQLGGIAVGTSGIAEVLGNDMTVTLGAGSVIASPSPDTDGDGLSDTWETNGFIDANCNGVINNGGGTNFDAKRALHYKYAVFGHNVVCTPSGSPETAAPAFFKNCCAGAHYKKVVINMRKAGGDPSSAGKPYLRFKFATPFTTKIDWSGPGDERPTETIDMTYGAVEWEYTREEKDGSSSDCSSSSPCTWCVPQ